MNNMKRIRHQETQKDYQSHQVLT